MTSLISVSEFSYDADNLATVNKVDLFPVPAGTDPVDEFTKIGTYFLNEPDATEPGLFIRDDEHNRMEPFTGKPDGRSFVSFMTHLPGNRIRSVSLIPDLETV